MSDQTFTQDDRFAKLTTEFGKDVLLLNSVQGSERMGELFAYRVVVQSQNETVAYTDLLGTGCTIEYGDAYLHGVITDFEQTCESDSIKDNPLDEYTFTFRPWAWLLTQTSHCRTFANMTVSDIVSAVCADAQVDVDIADTPNTRVSDAQYNESDFDFLYRLLQREGLTFFFIHADGSQTMKIVADPASLPDISIDDPEEVRARHHLCTNTVQQTGYDYQNPQNLVVQLDDGGYGTDLQTLQRTLDSQDDLSLDDAAETCTQAYNATWQKRFETLTARSDDPTIQVGRAFNSTWVDRLKSGSDSGESEKVVITNVNLKVTNCRYEPDVATSDDLDIELQYDFVRADRLPGLPTIPNRARIDGIQSAKVIDNADPLNLGRLLLRFFWDGQDDESAASTAWARVCQMWASNSFGGHSVPEVDDEVLCGFENGNPNRPVVIGRLHNSANLPPDGDLTNQTILQTRSGHQLIFTEDDSSETQGIFFHSTNDFSRVVDNDDELKVSNNRTVTIDEGDDSLTLNSGGRSVEIKEGDDELKVNAGDRSVEIAEGDLSVNCEAGNIVQQAGDSISLQAESSISLQVGGNSIEITPEGITLSVGGSAIELSESGVTISGAQITVSADASLELSSSAILEASGSAEVTLQGGIVMIN
ncbi:type VI secretion system Vgr family protein [Thalassoroseus pseudoceratinae]|uniref:type VI secretion system Vgr family protein n=1 Tax=Thalassoroseus pseudoceratinae TaxID=2713176 RepID=UPI00142257D2|nr:type VI secretion system tip protein TssI/VgrG [Thalassoroseus pseudoceratinae]